MNTAKLIAEALAVRDNSLAEIEPPLPPLPPPESVPKNVLGFAKHCLTEEELKITSYDVPELLQVIREKIFTCETVTWAFLRRAALAQKLVSSINV